MDRSFGRGVAVLALVLPALAAGCDPEPRGEPSPRVQELVASADSGFVLRLPDGDTLTIGPAVVQFYRQHGYRQAWTDYDEVRERGLALLETMRSAETDGLDPERYRHALAERMLIEVEEDSLEEKQEPAQMAEVDLVLSEVFTRYAQHLAGGVVDPHVDDVQWNIPRDTAHTLDLLNQLRAGADPQAVVDSLRPAVPEYRRMRAVLRRYREIAAAGGWPQVPEATPSDVGAEHPGVAVLRRRLMAEGDGTERALAAAAAERPTVFDDSLKAALEHFQRRHSINPDGALGPATLKELNTSVDERILQLKLNLDRWRWLPRHLGEQYVLVNVAGFELEVVKDDEPVLAMNVVVGKDAWRTPIFRDTMEHIVVNPYWNVPASIKHDEVLPVARRDPGYLARNNFEVRMNGRRVSPYDVNLASSGVTFHQRPGRGNALGSVKFLFPNKNNIYLHDTPATHLFSQTSRAFSHGCIRVEKPRELAHTILRIASDRDPDDFDALKARNDEVWINLSKPLPVYILYFTAWAERDGTVHFHPDIYERDRRLQEQTRRSLDVVRS